MKHPRRQKLGGCSYREKRVHNLITFINFVTLFEQNQNSDKIYIPGVNCMTNKLILSVL